MSDDAELSELEFLQALMSDFDLTPEDTLADLIEALENDADTEDETD